MRSDLRDFFDKQLEIVLRGLPDRVHELIEEIPLVVEDHPSREIMQQLGVRRKDDLCGLYTGVPLNQRSIEISGVPSDVVHIFRRGILSLATSANGRVDQGELRRQIRVTILHELGHHHGLTEKELRELGY